MSVKASSQSRIKTIKIVCDRCKQIVEGIRGEEFSAGFYNMTKWEEYRRENEQYVCASCMFADPKYVERYGSCLAKRSFKAHRFLSYGGSPARAVAGDAAGFSGAVS
jgi:hypothetical protein